ncbi:MAG: PAS domain S-box protein [Ignavibacteriales bacterium]|nr:PAS domain S-box protein [Ignavibacteriales bacterium]
MFDKINIVFPLIITLLFLFTSISQPQSFLITKYSTDNGLPDNRVNDIAQDSIGRIWIAMASGIAMYDGLEWTKFGEKDGVPEVEYISIKIDEKGIIWFLPKELFKQKLIYINDGKSRVLAISQKIISAPNYSNAIDVSYSLNNRIIHISTINKGLIKYCNGKWSKLSNQNGLLSDTVSSLLKVDNELYVSTYKGVSIIDTAGLIKNFNFSSMNIDQRILSMDCSKTIIPDKKTILLLSTDWIGIFSEGRLKKFEFDFNIRYMGFNEPYSIVYHFSDKIIFGNSATIFSINLKTKKFEKIIIETPNSDRGGTKIFLDYEENVWITSLRGIYKLSYIPFKNYSQENGLLESEVSTISEFNSGRIFFGHNYGFSTLFDEKVSKKSLANSTDNKIHRIIDSYHDVIKNVIYFSSLQSGIGKLEEIQRISWINSIEARKYLAIIRINKKNFLVSTDNGFGQIKDDRLFFLSDYQGKHVRAGIAISDSVIYIATITGLEKYNFQSAGEIKKYDIEISNLFSVFNSDTLGLLVGSANGLYRLKNDSLIVFNFNDQSIKEPIYFIIQDSSKNIWLGTNNGVLKWDGKDLNRYNKSDGLAGNETNRAAGFVDSKGNVWIGTDEGVSMYTGKEPDYNLYPPKLIILGFDDASNLRHAVNLDVEVDPEKNNLTFHYRGLSFIDEKRNSYQIKLAKVGSDWEDQFYTTSTSARFNNLAYGDYIFSARVKNSKGIWSKWQKSSVITIRKYYYQEFLFQFSLLALLLFLMYSAYNYLQQKKYTKKLELAVDLRTKDLRDTQVELITSIDRYKGIVESQSDLVVRVDGDGNFTFINDAYCAVFGKKRDELIGKSFTPLIHPDDVGSTLEEMKKLNVPPFRIVIQQRALTSNGYRWFSWEDYAIHDYNGKIIEIQAVGRDITLQKEVESELEKRVTERTIELQSLISQSPLGILTFSLDGHLLDFNKAANEMFLNLNDFLPPNQGFNIFADEFLLKNNYKNSLSNLDTQNGFLLSVPIKIDNEKNKIYSNLYNHTLVYRIYSVIFDETNRMYVLLLDDVTENQKSAEVSKKLLEEKIRISTIIKTIETERNRIAKELHDGIGQQLTTAKLKLDIIKLKSEHSRAEIDEALGMLINAGDEIRRIINDLKPSDVEKLGLISSIELLCERIKQSSNIKLEYSASNISQLPTKEIELIIYRVVQEALNNIVKHSQCVNAGVEISSWNDSLSIKIWDDGIGSDKKEFYKSKNTFGLNNISERIKSVKGEVVVETKPGEGFKYFIKIPL